MWIRALIAAVLLLGGCTDPGIDPAPPIPPQILDGCHGEGCPPCGATRTRCAETTEPIEGTCCAAGDPLVHIAAGGASEAVHIAADGDHVALCGGFGARVNDIRDPSAPAGLGYASDRCQHAVFVHSGGEKFLVVTHHGDSWVRDPHLAVFRVPSLDPVVELNEPGVLYEGVTVYEDHLYVAAHAGGVRVYRLGDDGVPTFLSSVDAQMVNPWRLAVHGDALFVADRDVGVVVLSLADPSLPVVASVVETAARPADLAVTDTQVFVAEGGFGVEVFNREGAALSSTAVIDTQGTAQSVAATDDVLAVAAWSHVATYDPDSLVLLATERLATFPTFEQDLGIAIQGDHVLVAEWNDMHVLQHREGFVAADLWTDEQMLAFDATTEGARAVVVHNRGHLPLQISGVTPSHEAFGVDFSELILPPGQGDAFEVSFTSGFDVGTATVTVTSNDIDLPELPLGLIARDTARLDVGDRLTDAFAFLDPSGASQLSALEGHVTVLAYFALF